jgi:hypothetical protein
MNRRTKHWALSGGVISAVLALVMNGSALAQGQPGAAQPAAAGGAARNPNDPLTEKGVLKGDMFIRFDTRTQMDDSGKLREGSPKLGARDTYFFKLNVLNQVEFDGKIARQPTLYSRTLQKPQQEAMFDFEKLDISVINPRDPSQKRNVGRWTGVIPIDPNTGVYNLGGSADRPFRIFIEAVGRNPQIDERCGGRLVGKAIKKETLASYTYKRAVGNKTFEYTAKKVDPMKFENAELAMGPATIYPRVTINGRLDYDYETGNWITDGLNFNYKVEGKDVNDVVKGTIKWVEAKGSEKGYYEFNLRFNEDKFKEATDVGGAFEQAEGLDAFFAVDTRIPTLTGRITYDDKKDGDTVIESKVSYNLDANKLTRQQIMNFTKMWIVASGPANDE